jgi:hypothetical protein
MVTSAGHYRVKEAEGCLAANSPVACYVCLRRSPARTMEWYSYQGPRRHLVRPIHPACAVRYRGTRQVTRRIWRTPTEVDHTYDHTYWPYWEG